ncbi:MAG: hypothetical protein RL748_4029 [Pseudomonadota bacterium]|jgi:hypothetical protein
MLLETKEIEVAESNSVLGFATEGGGAWKIWDRYLTIDGQHAYHIGNICWTGITSALRRRKVVRRLP